MAYRSRKVARKAGNKRIVAHVVELRVHGVGGSTPEALLGVPHPSDTVLVAGDEAAGFYARNDDPDVEGYVWGRLTSGGIAQTFWIILLPFTFLNVGGWMYPPSDRSRWLPARAVSRVLLATLGLLLTLNYLLWFFAIITLLLLNDPRFSSSLDRFSRPQRAWAAIAIVALVGVLIHRVTRSRQVRFEAYRGPTENAKTPETKVARFGTSVLAEQSLGNQTLWSQPKMAHHLLWIHMGCSLVALGAVGGWTLAEINGSRPTPDFQLLFHVGLVLEIGVALALLVFYLAFERQTDFRFAGPITLAVIAVALTNGFFSGLWQFTAKTIQCAKGCSATTPPPSPIGDFSDAFGAAMLAFVAAILGWAIWHVARLPRQREALDNEGIPLNTAPAGEQANGLTDGARWRTAMLRAFTTGPRNADLVLSASAATFVVAAFLTLPDGIIFPSLVASLGESALTVIVTAAVPFFVYRARRPDTARKIGMLWDVLTFFPRRFHPLAVRPYAERAVPELQGRITHYRRCGKKVIVCGHSQGSVIAFAALAQLAVFDRTITSGVAFVTFGSPLAQLHARFFPEAFGAADLFGDLRSCLLELPDDECAGWRNFFRRTDYVGQGLFGCANSAGCDRELPDPPREPMFTDPSSGGPLVSPTDPPPPAWIRNTVHSYYLSERELRDWVDELKRTLA